MKPISETKPELEIKIYWLKRENLYEIPYVECPTLSSVEALEKWYKEREERLHQAILNLREYAGGDKLTCDMLLRELGWLK